MAHSMTYQLFYFVYFYGSVLLRYMFLVAFEPCYSVMPGITVLGPGPRCCCCCLLCVVSNWCNLESEGVIFYRHLW